MPIEVDGTLATRVYVTEYQVANEQSGLSEPVDYPPQGKACNIVGKKVLYNGTHYECVEMEATEVTGEDTVETVPVLKYGISTSGGLVQEVFTNPNGQTCSRVGDKVVYQGAYFECRQVGTEEVTVPGDLYHRRTRITFNANGGSSVPTQTKTWGVENVTEPTAPSRSNYNFLGWYTSSSGGSKVSFPFLAPDSDKTYYAQWAASWLPPTVYISLHSSYGGVIDITNPNTSEADYSVSIYPTSSSSQPIYTNSGSVSAGQIARINVPEYTFYNYRGQILYWSVTLRERYGGGKSASASGNVIVY